jgi:hypothetical protein
MKATKKIIPALVMLLVSAVLLSTASYAWFSMNTTVTATGMSVTATVSSNLLIAGDELDSTTIKAESAFITTYNGSSITGILEPVSTVNGKDYFYTTNAKADGDAIADAYVAYDVEAFNTAYGTTNAVGYIDYVFQLKATNTDTTTAKDIKLTQLDLTYEGATDGNKAYRVAVFAEDLGTTPTAPAGGVGTLVGIYSPSGAANQTPGEAVTSTTTTAAVVYNDATKVVTVAANSTNYYKVVVRLWLEGEDTTCTNATFLELTKSWTLDIALELGTGTVVNAITLKTTTPVEP